MGTVASVAGARVARSMAIDGVLIDDDSDCYVVAEIGQNHQGRLDVAMRLIEEAAGAGAQAVKLQKRDKDSSYTAELLQQPYPADRSFGPTYGAHRDFLEFGRREYELLQRHARRLGITLFATPFDVPSADFLRELDLPAYKIASGDLTNVPLLRHVAGFGRPIILSTGGATWEDVDRARTAVAAVNRQVCILHCTAIYPAEASELDVRVVAALRSRYPDAVVGFSDHSGIPMAPCLAYALGARMVERHLTLDRTWKGSDHRMSTEPAGLARLVAELRQCRQVLGQSDKRPRDAEAAHLFKTAKKLVAARDLPAGHVLGPGDVAMKAPADGLPPYELDRVVGRTTRRAVRRDENLTWEALT